jgi:hypothetical protein
MPSSNPLRGVTRRIADFFAPRADALPRMSGRVFVLGSAPRSQPPAEGVDWTFFTVNGSQAILSGWGHTPDVTLFGRTWRQPTPANLSAREVLRGLGTRRLICVGPARDHAYFKSTMDGLPYRYDDMHMLTPPMRRGIVEAMIGPGFDRAQKMSNGVIVGLIALRQGADEVVVSGLSLTQHGHAYNAQQLKRGHIAADARGLAEIRRLGLPLRTNDAVFAQESGLELRLD